MQYYAKEYHVKLYQWKLKIISYIGINCAGNPQIYTTLHVIGRQIANCTTCPHTDISKNFTLL